MLWTFFVGADYSIFLLTSAECLVEIDWWIVLPVFLATLSTIDEADGVWSMPVIVLSAPISIGIIAESQR